MSAQFKKALFGFNRNEVAEFINDMLWKSNALESELKAAKEASQSKEAELLNRIEELESELSSVKSTAARLEEENRKLGAELDEFKHNEAKLREVGNAMGKLYLVSRMNAEQLARSAEQSRAALEKELKKQLASAVGTAQRLTELSASVSDSSRECAREADEVVDSIDETKRIINRSLEELRSSSNELDRLGTAARLSLKTEASSSAE